MSSPETVGPKAAVEAAAKAGPFLLRETAVVYRCPFCRRSWRAQGKRRAERHLVHCFKNPGRVPYVGELSHRFFHDDAPWWPGVGKMWDGRQWRDVPGYTIAGERWPSLCGSPLDSVKPWLLRLEIFDDICLDSLRHPDDRGELAPLRREVDDDDAIRAIHGSAA